MKYYSGRNNLSCTIFVPFACGNDCPFCTSKEMYSGYVTSNDKIEKILDKIQLINKCDIVKSYVITGGEPFMNLNVLKVLISAMTKPVYINTSLPNVKNISEIIQFINRTPRIEGINVSRHIGYEHNVKVCDIDVLDKIKKHIRINTIINENNLPELDDYINKYVSPYRMINLRGDYRYTTQDNLKSPDAVCDWLLERYKYEYANQCLVCNSQMFSDEESKVICYHRGLEHSCVTVGERTYVNDIIIDIHGDMYKDWDMIPDEEFNEWVRLQTL